MARPFDFDFESFKKKLLKEIRNEARQIVRDMMAELREERQAVAPIAPAAPPAPQYRPFDLDAETSRKQPIEDDQETLLAEPITRQRLDILKEIEKLDWANDLIKTMAQMQIQMKKKGIEAPLDYIDLDLYKGNDPLPQKFKFLDMRKYSGNDDPHLHLKQYVTYMSATELTNAQIVKQFSMSSEGAVI